MIVGSCRLILLQGNKVEQRGGKVPRLWADEAAATGDVSRGLVVECCDVALDEQVAQAPMPWAEEGCILEVARSFSWSLPVA